MDSVSLIAFGMLATFDPAGLTHQVPDALLVPLDACELAEVADARDRHTLALERVDAAAAAVRQADDRKLAREALRDARVEARLTAAELELAEARALQVVGGVVAGLYRPDRFEAQRDRLLGRADALVAAR